MRSGFLIILNLMVILSWLVVPASAQNADQKQLREMRAARRTATRAKNIKFTKAGQTAPFSLLVIPVDFSDARLPQDWNNTGLSKRLNEPSGESLNNYFDVASFGKLDLKVTLAPLVHLPETRRLYSDRDLNGSSRTRKLAREAITAARDNGLIFRTLDNDGADGQPGTADDDGMVDGVLILHAAPGTENDPAEGLIQALQFYLDEPIFQQGVAASFYAVASLQSGTGIWAHESAHLMGMEDRYDHTLPSDGASEALSRGGLGKFSLMASGAWGTGQGYGAALPDGYSSAQLGWLTVLDLQGNGDTVVTLRPGEAGRLWTQGVIAKEFFLLETRSAELSAPFDAAMASEQLMITHIDEQLAEGEVAVQGGGLWHLRARMVEADNDRGLALGQDNGRDEDLFPGPLAVNEFGPLSVPSSLSYYSGATGVSVSEITAIADGVQFRISVDTDQSVLFQYSFSQLDQQLQLTVQESGQPMTNLRCRLTATSLPAYGSFQATGTSEIAFDFVETAPGIWQPDTAVFWNLAPGINESDRTRFQFQFITETGTIAIQSRWWIWQSSGTVLDFRDQWPGTWAINHPEGNLNTTWQRWTSAPWLTANQDVVLACVDAQYTTSAAWPNVTYANSALTTLTSAAMSSQVVGVRLTHSMSSDRTDTILPRDGGLVVWVGPDGQEHPAQPLEGYGYRIDAIARTALHGEAAFAAPELPLRANLPTWRTDAFMIPAGLPGPWQLRFKFASDGLWRARGWYIADLEPLQQLTSSAGFVPVWNKDLTWYWPWPGALPEDFSLEMRRDEEDIWAPFAVTISQTNEPGVFSGSGGQIIAAMDNLGQRHQVRVVGTRPAGQVASQGIVIYPDGGYASPAALSLPWPNPAQDKVSLSLEVPAGGQGRLRVYDLRGRLISTQDYGPGQHLAVWDGRSDGGKLVASGVYIFRLEGSGPVLTRKVVLIH